MADISIALNNIELYPEFVKEVSTFNRQKGDIGNVILLPELTLELENSDNYFSFYNPKSIFYGRTLDDVRDMTLVITIDGVVVWDGKLKTTPEANTNSGTATLTSITKLDDAFNTIRNTTYIQTTSITPAYLFRDILTYYGFVNYLDNASIEKSNDILNDGGVFVTCSILARDNHVLYDILQQIGSVGCAKIYVDQNGKLHYETYDSTRPVVISYNLDEEHYNELEIDNFEVINYDDYSIKTSAGTITKGVLNPKNILDSMSYGDDDIITLTSLTGGAFLGDLYIYNRANYKGIVSSKMLYSIAPLRLNQIITITNERQGLNLQQVEIFEIGISNNYNIMQVKGYIL